MSLTKTIKVGDYEVEIKRYTFKERMLIQSKAIEGAGKAKVDEKGEADLDIDFTKLDVASFMTDSILYGIKSMKCNGQEVKVTRELIESMDYEIASILYREIKALNEKSFFSKVET